MDQLPLQLLVHTATTRGTATVGSILLEHRVEIASSGNLVILISDDTREMILITSPDQLLPLCHPRSGRAMSPPMTLGAKLTPVRRTDASI